MTDIIIMVAVARNNVIGANNQIPWSLGKDMRYVKQTTMGHPCVMGRKTYESIPEKWRPLPGRENIVLTSQKDYHAPGATIFGSLSAAMKYTEEIQAEKVFILGGAMIYKISLEIADKMILTRIDADFNGETRFPEVNWDDWELTRQEDQEDINRIDGVTLNLSFNTYRKI